MKINSFVISRLLINSINTLCKYNNLTIFSIHQTCHLENYHKIRNINEGLIYSARLDYHVHKRFDLHRIVNSVLF